MMRLPYFRYHSPTTVREAAELLAKEGSDAMLLAGGTDLLPNMKRRQQVPETLIGLRDVAELKKFDNGTGLRLGAGLTLTALETNQAIKRDYPGLWQAVAQVATTHLRNMGTLGGNICLDTRCTYYDQNYEWRKAIDFCLKKDGDTCWVATRSPKCLAVSSTDTAPALVALDAQVKLVSAEGERTVRLTDLYRNDGIDYMTRRPDEIVTEIELPEPGGWKSTYWKLRRRGSFDFPVLSVAAAVRFDSEQQVADARLVLGAVSSCPAVPESANEFLIGKRLTDEVIEEAAGLAAKLARPMDNTDFTLHWRKRMAARFVTYALQEVRGDDMSAQRIQIAHHDLETHAQTT